MGPGSSAISNRKGHGASQLYEMIDIETVSHMPDEEQRRCGRLHRGKVRGDVVDGFLQLQQIQADQPAHRRVWQHLHACMHVRAHQSNRTL